MEDQKHKKRKVVDIILPAKATRGRMQKKDKAETGEEPGLADFLISKKPAEKKFFYGSSSEELERLNIKIESEMEGIDEKIEEFEKEEKETFKKDDEKLQEKASKSKRFILLSAAILVVAGTVSAAIFLLPKTKISISLKRETWKFEDVISASKDQNQTDAAKRLLAAEVFPIRKNFSFPFPATGKKNAAKKASATIKIWNEFSAAPQTLIATTRFLTPDGKIFRLEKTTVVPGAKIENKMIVPSSVEAVAYADEAGTQYNIGPFDRLTIPGLKGSPKYEKFYGETESVAKGGFIGETAYPTSEDIKTAKAKAADELEKNIQFLISSQLPGDVKVLPAAKQFSVLKQEVNTDVDDQGNFTVYTDAEISALGFKESDLLDLMTGLAVTDLKFGKTMKNYSLEYKEGNFNAKKGEITFKIYYSADYVPEFDVQKFKESAFGKKEKDLRLAIYNLPEVDKASVSFWPLWVKAVPRNPEKVSVSVD